MRTSRLRKLGALMAGLLAAAVVPTAASAATVKPDLTFGHVALVPGGAAKVQPVYLFAYQQTYTLHDVTAVIDASELAGVATSQLTSDDHCSAAKSVYTCAFGTLSSFEGFANITAVGYQAADGAKVGAEGSVSIKLTSRELGTISKTVKITVAEGVDLAADGWTLLNRAAGPGGTVSVPLGVRNDGDNPITGVDLSFFMDPWYDMAKHYSNCLYGTSAAYCHFDTELKPGTAYALSEQMGMKLRADIPAPSTVGQEYDWYTQTDDRDNVDLVNAQKPKRGTDGALTLTAMPSAEARSVPQTNTSGEVTWRTSIVTVTGTQGSDVAAVGAHAEGAKGATVTAAVGVKNLGPAFVYGFPDPAAKVTVTPPGGTTVVSVPEGCAKSGSAYVCTTTAMPLNVKASETWPFKLRIDKPGTLTGKVAVKSSAVDGNAANDTAALVVGPPTTTAGGTAAGGTGSGGTGEQGGLAFTGAPTMLIFGAGLLLVVGGVVAYGISRRRRARFIA